jgi:Sensors of blue-light using FAD
MTYQIIYSSESATPMQLDDLEDILEHARSSNASKGITGALVYVDGVFLQILEGPESSVKELMARIADDVRHETVTVLKETVVDSPVFADWKMAYVSASKEQIARWAGLSSTAEVPEILDSIRSHPSTATQVAQSILAVLAPDSGSHSRLR